MLIDCQRNFFIIGIVCTILEYDFKMGNLQKWQTMVIMALMVWTLIRFEVEGLIAYDCESDKTDISAVSLRDVAKCPELSSAYQSKTVFVRVLQRRKIGLQHVWTCLIEVTRLITHCGTHSHSSVVTGGLLNFVHQVGNEECRSIHQYETLKLYQVDA